MDRSPTELGLVPVSEGGGRWRRRFRAAGPFVVVGALILVVVLAVGGSAARTAVPDPTGTPTASGPALVAVVDETGALSTIDGEGGSHASYDVPGVTFGFPTWSPDGLHLAVVGYGSTDTEIYVFGVHRGGPEAGTTSQPGAPGSAPGPVVIYGSAKNPPFYLFWTPDSRSVAFLATDPAGIALRIAPADGSEPLDGSGPRAVIRRGTPLYFDWEGPDRLLVHVGSGSAAFVGEVGLDGASAGPPISGGGDFRAASASTDGRYLAYVRGGADPSSIVVASRDGSAEHELPVFGPAAFVFDPVGDTVATIAAAATVPKPLAFPLGPLRLLDPRSGAVRTLLDGSVFAFFWSPDGRTIAALRLAGSGGQVAGRGPRTELVVARPAAGPMLATPAPAASAAPDPGVHLVLVDVATGAIRSDRPVRLGDHFVGELLPYFDQYALSHRLWAPDGSSLLLPVVDATGRSRLTIVPTDGSEARPVADGISGFWSP